MYCRWYFDQILSNLGSFVLRVVVVFQQWPYILVSELYNDVYYILTDDAAEDVSIQSGLVVLSCEAFSY